MMMKKAFVFILPGFLCALQLLSACTQNTADNSNSASREQVVNQNSSENAVRSGDTAENLKTLINLPFEPEETVWQENTVPARGSEINGAPNDHKNLTAILRFSAEDASKLVAQAETYKSPVPKPVQTEEWFPAELNAQSELSGDETLKGTAFAVNDFIQPPYKEGQLVRIENSNYFILELSAR